MANPITFQPGTFKKFRATTQIAMPESLGIPTGYISEDAIIEYDGQTLKYGGTSYNIGALRSAINRVGWFVPVEDTETRYVPQSAQVNVHKATSANEERGAPMTIDTVVDENRHVGNVHKAITLTDSSASSDGEVVSKIKTAAHQRTVLTDSSQVSAAIHKLDNTPPPKAEAVKKAMATGDVQETMVGDDLEDILPEAESAGTPKPGVAGEGNYPHLTSEERAEAIRQARLAKMGKQEDAEAVDTPADAALRAAKIAAIQAILPEFKWDMSTHWRTRVKNALAQRDNPQYLNAILAIEIEAVKKHVQAELA